MTCTVNKTVSLIVLLIRGQGKGGTISHYIAESESYENSIIYREKTYQSSSYYKLHTESGICGKIFLSF